MADNSTFDASALLEVPITDAYKGFPFGQTRSLGSIGSMGWNALRGDVPFPVALIRRSALEDNIQRMARYLARRGVRLSPHVKTTMAPQLMQRQIAAGAWALTVATLHQLRVCRRFGARRVLLANQLVGDLELDALAMELAAAPDLEVYCLVDSHEGLEALERAAGRRTLEGRVFVLVELGYMGGRSGCRSIPAALSLMRQVRRAKGVRLVGLETFEGLNQFHEPAHASGAVRGLLENCSDLFRRARAENLFETERPILSAGGSAFYPQVIDAFTQLDADVVIRSGCYLTHDHGIYEHWQERAMHDRAGDFEPLQPALEVWGRVQSLPEAGLAIVTAGRRDIGFDSGLPKPILRARAGRARPLTDPTKWSTVAFSDQHAHVRVPSDSDLAVGDPLGFGISHPCTTFDKWPLLYLVDDNYRIVEGIRTFF